MIILYIILIIIGVILLGTIIHLAVLGCQKIAPEHPTKKYEKYKLTSQDAENYRDLYLYLSNYDNSKVFTESEMYEILKKQTDYIDNRFDCADFRTILLFKIYKDCGSQLSDRCKDLIKTTFLKFKYFMDEPGDDSMCLWSENHQIIFAVSEYLAGQQWPDEVFTNSGLTGSEHQLKAQERINGWIESKFKFGFCEYLSDVYLAEDIAPMANYILYSKDEKTVEKMTQVLNLLFFDIALHTVNNRFVATSSRMYGNNKASNYLGNSIQASMNILWCDECIKLIDNGNLTNFQKEDIKITLQKMPNNIGLAFYDLMKKGKYKLPQVITDVAFCKSPYVAKMSFGLSPQDMKDEGLIGQKPNQILAQFGAETFTNPEVFENTVKYIKNNKLYRNSMIFYFKFLTVPILKPFSLNKFASKHQLMTHGIALGRGNIYTYKTKDYLLTTSVNKNVDVCGAQDHVFTANISNDINLFTTHPSGNGDNKFGSSPGYWIGNGRRPMSMQNENVNITIYKLPTKKRLPETAIAKMTHAYMPQCLYDEFELKSNYAFGRKDNVFVALISNGEMKFKPFNKKALKPLYKSHNLDEMEDRHTVNSEFDLCRFDGDYHIYITELSDSSKETFEEFKQRILSNKIDFSSENAVEYTTHFGKFYADYNGKCQLNDEQLPTQFKRYDTPFCVSERKADSITIKNQNSEITLTL